MFSQSISREQRLDETETISRTRAEDRRDLVQSESRVHHFDTCFDSFVTQPSSHSRRIDFQKGTKRAERSIGFFHRCRFLIVVIDDHVAQMKDRREKTKDRHLYFTLNS
jgi:hypothetical protein